MSTNVTCGMRRWRLAGAAGAAVLAGVVGAAPPPTLPAVGVEASPPWWRQPVMHTDQENLFLLWMDMAFGPGWGRVLPDHAVHQLWAQFQGWQTA